MRDNLDEARRKVSAAEAVQKETEEKWPEIVIDDEASTDSPPSKKRQKIAAPSSTGGIAIATPTTVSIVAAATVDRSTQVTGGISDVVGVSNAAPDVSTSIVVKGCSILEANGTYNRIMNKSGTFSLAKLSFESRSLWYIGVWVFGRGNHVSLCKQESTALGTQPSENGWILYTK
jgi:hypothetical protein